MRYERTKKALMTGLVAIAALATSASAWCPSIDGSNISCSNCSRTLTCNYSGGITISGNNVDLDGDGYTLSGSSGHGVNITGTGSDIVNLNVTGADDDGIHYADNVGGWLDNVYVDYSGLHGMYNHLGSVSVDYSTFYYNDLDGVHSYQNGEDYVDLNSSALGNNGQNGYRSIRGAYIYHTDNSYNGNVNNGSNDYHGNGGVYVSNYFTYNDDNGLYLTDRDEDWLDLVANTGYGNDDADCKAVNVNGMVESQNSWTDNQGCVEP